MCEYVFVFFIVQASVEGKRTQMVALRRISPLVLAIRWCGRLFRDATVTGIPERLSASLPLIDETNIETHHAALATPLFGARLTGCGQAVVRV